MKEAFLEPLLRRLRIRRVVPVLKRYPRCRILDVGCGWEAKFLRSIEPYIECGCGIDFKAPKMTSDKLRTMEITLDRTLPFENASFDVVVMLAVLEHLEHHIEIVEEVFRVLRPGGVLLLTAPSHKAKPVLEFLAYKLSLISKDEIQDHKRYFDREELQKLFGAIGFSAFTHTYFQFGMNNFCIVER